MKIALLYAEDLEEDPVVGQLSEAIAAGGHEVQGVVARDRLEPLIEVLNQSAPDLVFNLAESFGGISSLDSNVAALLTLLGLRYTGSSPAGLLLAGDKALAKKVLSFHGLKTPEFATLHRGAVEWAGALQFPVIVKPPLEDASIGLHSRSVVYELKDLLVRLDEIHSEYKQPALIEQFIEGREFYVGVLGNAHPEALPIIELDFSGFPEGVPRIASWEAKWGDESGAGAEFSGTRSVLARDVDEQLANEVRRVAVEAFQALRLRDYARIDMRVSASGEPFILEVNPNCYLERESEFARSAAEHGLDYNALTNRIIELAMGRYNR
jgi:D-alanine-D-alanine ligase